MKPISFWISMAAPTLILLASTPSAMAQANCDVGQGDQLLKPEITDVNFFVKTKAEFLGLEFEFKKDLPYAEWRGYSKEFSRDGSISSIGTNSVICDLHTVNYKRRDLHISDLWADPVDENFILEEGSKYRVSKVSSNEHGAGQDNMFAYTQVTVSLEAVTIWATPNEVEISCIGYPSKENSEKFLSVADILRAYNVKETLLTIQKPKPAERPYPVR